MRPTISPTIGLFLLLLGTTARTAETFDVSSPNGRLSATATVDGSVSYKIFRAGRTIIEPSTIDLRLSLPGEATPRGEVAATRSETDRELEVSVPRKRRVIRDRFNELLIRLGDGRSLRFRAYDEAIAYRWETAIEGRVRVLSERAAFTLPEDAELWWPRETSVVSPQEPEYERLRVSEVGSSDLGSTGVLASLEGGTKVYLAEADLRSYPGMFLRGDDRVEHALVGRFARRYETLRGGEREEDLAETDGTRTYPWRFVLVADDDTQLVDSEIVYKLAPPCELENVSWIRPGKVAWEWWHAINLRGVDFVAGINTETYKHYADFAAESGIEYILLDFGWSADKKLHEVTPDLDLPALIDYARGRGVGVVLWANWRHLEGRVEEVFDRFRDWGVVGVKIDYMNRDDQAMVDFYWRVAKEAAERRLLVDLHGSYKPTGLRRAYPNVITREGVRGLEYSKGTDTATPEHDVTLPFTRMVMGPLDYTPGAMRNAIPADFRPIQKRPMSQGTRCHQLAMFVVYESPLQMLCDSPSDYRDERECLEFLSVVPTVWDDTRVLDGVVSDYVVVARRSGDRWFLGAMTDDEAREVEVSLDFLGDGEHRLTQWADGINSHRHAEDYRRSESTVTSGSTLRVRMAPGGGWAAVVEPAAR